MVLAMSLECADDVVFAQGGKEGRKGWKMEGGLFDEEEGDVEMRDGPRTRSRSVTGSGRGVGERSEAGQGELTAGALGFSFWGVGAQVCVWGGGPEEQPWRTNGGLR